MKIKRPIMSYLKQLIETANYYGFNNSTYLFLEEVGFFLASEQHKVDSAAGRPGRCSQPSLPNRPHLAKLNYLTNFALYFFVLEIFLTHFSYSCFFKMGHSRPLFVYFHSFQTQYYRKTLGFSGIRTRIVGVEGEHADHLTTTMALPILVYGN